MLNYHFLYEEKIQRNASVFVVVVDVDVVQTKEI